MSAFPSVTPSLIEAERARTAQRKPFASTSVQGTWVQTRYLAKDVRVRLVERNINPSNEVETGSNFRLS